jgi:HK97 family phage portal protein
VGLLREFRDFVTSFSAPDNMFGMWGATPSEAGVTVNELSALQSAAICGCIRLIAGSVASLPLNIYEIDYTKNSKQVALEHDLQSLLNEAPNPETDSFIFRETLQTHLLLAGNCYIEKRYDNGGRIAALYQRSPFRTFPYRTREGLLVYKTTDGSNNGLERTILAADMIHIRGMSLDGLVGMNPIKTYCREVVGIDLAARAFGARLFANDSTPSGILSTDKLLKGDSRKQLESSWKTGHSGSSAHKFAVLDGGLKWQSISLSPEESQFLATREFQVREIGIIFGVPPHLLGGAEERAANTEQQMLRFLNFTIRPWLKRWESSLSAKLLPTVGRAAGQYIIRFDTQEMERGDFETRLKAISTGRQWGIYTANEARELIGSNPIDVAVSDNAADQLWMPVNMVIAPDVEDEAEVLPSALPPGTPDPLAAPAAAPNATPAPVPTAAPAKPAKVTKSIDRITGVYSRSFREAFHKVLAAPKPDNKAFTRAFTAPLAGIADYLYMDEDPDFRAGNDLPTEVAGFISDFIGGMRKRSIDWKEEQWLAELLRAAKAIKIAVVREIATRKAKEEPEEQVDAEAE